MKPQTLTALAWNQSADGQRDKRRRAAYQHAKMQIEAAIENVLELRSEMPKIGLREFRFDGARGTFPLLQFKVDDIVFVFDYDPREGHYADRLIIWEIHGVAGFREVIWSLADLGAFLRSLPRTHPATDKVAALRDLDVPAELKKRGLDGFGLWDKGSWQIEKSVWETSAGRDGDTVE